MINYVDVKFLWQSLLLAILISRKNGIWTDLSSQEVQLIENIVIVKKDILRKLFKNCELKIDQIIFDPFLLSNNKEYYWLICTTSSKVDIDQGIHKAKMKVALNEKWKKLCGFSFSINIANFEAFLLVFKLTKNLLFLKSALIVSSLLSDFLSDHLRFRDWQSLLCQWNRYPFVNWKWSARPPPDRWL